MHFVLYPIKGPLGSIEPNIKRSPCMDEVLISWKPPFTLQGVPILGYNINITNITAGKLLSKFTQATNIQVSLVFGDDYNVSIAGVNGAGLGNKSTVSTNLYKGTDYFTLSV